MNEKTLPKTLYKFRDWSNKYNQKMLIDNELFFANNYSFNDPFDLQLPILFNLVFDRDAFIENFKKTRKIIPTEEELQKAKEMYPEMIKNSPELLENTKKEMESDAKRIENQLGVFCLSSRNNSSLMWGHYSNSHKGFCVGLDSVKLNKYIKETFSIGGDLKKVDYVSEIPSFTSLRSNKDEINKYSRARFSSKFIDWAYEDEYRIIIDKMANKAHGIPKEIYKEIIFGYKISESHENEIRTLCNNVYPDIEFYKSEPNRETFEMKISRIE